MATIWELKWRFSFTGTCKVEGLRFKTCAQNPLSKLIPCGTCCLNKLSHPAKTCFEEAVVVGKLGAWPQAWVQDLGLQDLQGMGFQAQDFQCGHGGFRKTHGIPFGRVPEQRAVDPCSRHPYTGK